MSEKKVIYCRCAYADVVPKDVKAEVLRRLCDEGVAFEAVTDLCEMSARKDERLNEIAKEDGVQIVACFPRAVKWLFSSAGVKLDDAKAEVFNMRKQSADEIFQELQVSEKSTKVSGE